jgi:hypothetical protein
MHSTLLKMYIWSIEDGEQEILTEKTPAYILETVEIERFMGERQGTKSLVKMTPANEWVTPLNGSQLFKGGWVNQYEQPIPSPGTCFSLQDNFVLYLVAFCAKTGVKHAKYVRRNN